MNLKFTYIITLALSLAACSADKEPPPQEIFSEENPVYMSFSVSFENGGTKAGTRAEVPSAPPGAVDWGNLDKDRPGNEFESVLLSENFRPVLVEADNYQNIAGEFKILSYWETKEDGVTTYTIHGSFKPEDRYKEPDELRKAHLKLMVFANTPSDALDIPNNEFDKLTFDYISNEDAFDSTKDDAGNEGFAAIPMWGVCPVDLSSAKPGSYTLINPTTPCALLRAMAKVEVRLALKGTPQENTDVRLLSVEMNRVNNRGNVTPGKWDEISATTVLKLEDTMRENTDNQATGTTDTDGTVLSNPYVNQKVRVDKEGNQYISFYIPEISNVKQAITEGSNLAKDALELTINYKIGENGQVKSNHLYFTPYSGGGPAKDASGAYQIGDWNVIRNHIYEYKITGVQDSKITVEARVKDWQYHKSSVDLEE
ncbi:MAG: hypothetical protein K2G69_01225 [Muribaculaceae bacterium]|nr:hypothetical protein [Muribaculaceae bacterium]